MKGKGLFKLSNNAVTITEKDKLKLRKLWNDMHSQGYLSFIENDPQVKRWNVKEKREDRKQNFLAEIAAHIRGWNVKNKRDARKHDILMIVLYLILIVIVGMIVFRKLGKLTKFF